MTVLTRVVALGAALLAAGCAGEVQSKVTVIPPQAVAQPAPPAGGGGGDGDGDGVADAADRCPGAREDGVAPAGSDGCPAQDGDGDGVVAGDRCPTEAETRNGYQDDDGCPDELPAVRLVDHRLILQDELAFGGLGRLLPASDGRIDELAKWLGDHPEVERLEVGAHVRGAATPPGNQGASMLSARSVVDALVRRGVDRGRLQSTGYGDRCPEAGRAQGGEQVRITFTVVKQGGQDTGATLGCPGS